MSSGHLFSVGKMSGVRAFQPQKRICASWNWFCVSKRRACSRTVGTLKLSDLCPSIPPFPFSPRRAGVQSAPWPYWAGKRRHHAGIMLWVLLEHCLQTRSPFGFRGFHWLFFTGGRLLPMVFSFFLSHIFSAHMLVITVMPAFNLPTNLTTRHCVHRTSQM